MDSGPSTATLGQPLAGGAALEPSVVIQGVVERVHSRESHGTERPYYIGCLNSLRLAQVTYAPLTTFRGSACVRIRSKHGYQEEPSVEATRAFADWIETAPSAYYVPPVILSGRGRWVWHGEAERLGELRLYDAAAIVDGRIRIGGFALLGERGLSHRVDFVLLPSLSLDEERALYATTRSREGHQDGGTPASDRSQPPSAHPGRTLKVGTGWREVDLLSEPYVVSAPRGYSTMMDVRNVATGELEGLYVGAKSLSTELESIRARTGSLSGHRLRLRRESEEQYAGYVVQLLW